MQDGGSFGVDYYDYGNRYLLVFMLTYFVIFVALRKSACTFQQWYLKDPAFAYRSDINLAFISNPFFLHTSVFVHNDYDNYTLTFQFCQSFFSHTRIQGRSDAGGVGWKPTAAVL